jgi:3-hydroxyisobutyrate dehydrogenase
MAGGVMKATAGTLTFMVGCKEEELKEISGPLNAMGANLFACGGPGAGSIAKIVNNHILGIMMMGTSEALSLGEKLGGDPKALSDILAASTGGSACISMYNPIPNAIESAPSNN